MKARFTKIVLEWSVAIFMISSVTIRAVEKRVILLIVRTETTSTCSFKYSLSIFPGLLSFLFLHVLLKLFLITDQLLIILNGAILFYCIQIGKIVKIVNLIINQSLPNIFIDDIGDILVLYFLWRIYINNQLSIDLFLKYLKGTI